MSTVNIRLYICTGETGRWKSFSSKGTITCSRPELKTHCVYLITRLKFRFWPLLARNASETPQDRWHYEANAGRSACIVVMLWGKRSGLAPSMTRRRFPGVSNGRHLISSHLSRSSISPFFNFSLKLSTFPAPSSFYCVKNMRYNRSRFAGKKVDEQTRQSASPLLGLNYLFRRSLIQLDRSAIQYSSVYDHIYNCPLLVLPR